MVKNSLRILTLTKYYLPGYKGGGPIKTIKNLVDQLGDDISFRLITSDRDLGDGDPYSSIRCGEWNQVGSASVFYAEPGVRFYWQVAKIIWKNDYDLIYLNSFFSPRFSFFPLIIARILKQRVILGPRGEFSEGALSLKSFKKGAFIRLAKMLGIYRGVVFQASSEFEAEDIRKTLGPVSHIRIAENISGQEFASSFPSRSTGPLKAVFVSRISPKKNLLTALEMLKNVQQPLLYHIYGPVEDVEYWGQCERLIKVLPNHIKVEYMGTLSPDEVITTLACYDVFFFPTKGENYGHVIAEALCSALPVLIADTTPWRNLWQRGIGWELPLYDSDAFGAVLDELSLMSPDEYHEMRERVLCWAKKKFAQQNTIKSNISLFRYASEKK